ncbi:thioredoxin domain-containing protein [Spongisporangium articulatum]|uniref:Thioredoxin domain-containing protein n=1 Tax=Spongisporangium articulatum TaxID=3362603 RepID=A0ABW8AQE0_9ACTN
MNRLGQSTSPYLQQHRDNPVDWWEWSDAAFEAARERDVPVLLSIGYAACHWCHVMAHESFEDEATAAQMNASFVNVKVDREERPDVDAVYMAATQALTGQGGWPMTVFLTPEGRPFYAGTYFPNRPHPQLPSFRQLLTAIEETWRDRRPEVLQASAGIAEALAERTIPTLDGVPSPGLLAEAVRILAGQEDAARGGFGGAPKFPPSMVLEFLLRHAATPSETASTAGGIADRTLTAMARGGIYDQVAGGFARYSVDAAWVVPHFEKMLYDNAQLARVYLHHWRLTGSPQSARIALETCDFIVRDLSTAQGGFASSLDADTDGEEGLTYVWTPEQLVEVLGPDDGAWAAELLAVTGRGTFEKGTSTLQLTRLVDGTPDADRWTDARARLAAHRAGRPQPGLDDKVVAAWNGLAVAALAETGVLLERPDLLEAATRAADLLLGVHLVDDRLRRVSRDGTVGAPAGVLEDYADLAEGLLTLHATTTSETGAARWLAAAGSLLDVVLAQFLDADGLHDTPADGTDAALAAVRRPADPSDNAYPSGTSAAAGALLAYGALTGSARHTEAGERALGVTKALAARSPQAVGWGLAVAQALVAGPREVAVAGPAGPGRDALQGAALASTRPGLVISAGTPDAAGVPLLADRGGSDAPRAFVCENFACRLPVGTVAELTAQLSS